uniref:CSN8_PSD8_EIF3K domain-containing protein n=1 Tax=Elaeophora elaphi TaxID=1147741 RepID=A0A0R3RYW0_9BILA
MSEVPDVSENLNNEPVGGYVVSVVPENDESLQMDAEDSLPSPSFPLHHHTSFSDAPFVGSSPFISKLQSFEQREVQPNERDVDVEFFSQLLIFYMIKEDWAKARQCRLRAEATVTNIQLNTLMLICHHLEDGDSGAALHLIKNSHFDNPIKDLLMEVHKRTILSVLQLVGNIYINIEAKKLAEMLDAESNELEKILSRIDWQLEDGYVLPKITPSLVRKLKKMDDSPFGPIPAAFGKATCGMIKSSADVDTLIQYATFLEINT